MARIYSVRQRLNNKRFDMTCSSDEEGWAHPIGYCVGWKEMTDEEYQASFPWANAAMIQSFKKDHEKQRPFQAKYHSDGHETREQAEACYREYELDQEVESHLMGDQQRKCALCDAWTQIEVRVGQFKYFYLCEAHNNRAGVEHALEKE